MNANRQLNVYNLQIGEEICIPIRRSDMMNDNINGSMNNSMMNNNMRNSNMNNNNNMNNTNNSAMPDMQASEEEQGAGSAGAGSMEYTSVETASAASESFDKSIKMSELINQEDMTFEKFLSLIQN